MNDSRITVKVAFRLSGRMTCRNLTQAPPSSRAASKYSSGIERIPAMKMTRAMPTPFQTSTMATDRSAMLGLDSHCGPSIPTTSSERLTSPVDGCISTANVMPTATVLTRTGKKIDERRTLRIRVAT